MTHLGIFTPGSTVRYWFNSIDGGAAPITLASGTLRVYKAGDTTEDDSGVTLSTDFDTRTGLHHVAVDTSTDTTFYLSGSDYVIVPTVGTVSGTSVVGAALAAFTLYTTPAGSSSLGLLLHANSF